MSESAFSKLSLAEPLSRAVAEMGYESMTPIQAQAIPVVLTGKDVMGAAQTGTGKTAAFSLPLLQRLLKHENASTSPARHPVRALVLLPTRELADQVAQHGGVRRHRHEAADAGTEEGRRGAGGHAGAPAGPHRSQERRPEPGGVRR